MMHLLAFLPLCIFLYLSFLSLVYREFKECGLGASRLLQTRISKAGLCSATFNEDNMEQLLAAPEALSEEGRSDEGRKMKASWKRLAECFQGTNSLI